MLEQTGAKPESFLKKQLNIFYYSSTKFEPTKDAESSLPSHFIGSFSHRIGPFTTFFTLKRATHSFLLNRKRKKNLLSSYCLRKNAFSGSLKKIAQS